MRLLFAFWTTVLLGTMEYTAFTVMERNGYKFRVMSFALVPVLTEMLDVSG